MKTMQELFVRRLNDQPNLHKRPFTTLKVAGVALLAGLMAGPMVFPKALRAQDTSTQAVTTDKKQLPPELAKLPKVSLAKMQKLDSATYRPTSDEPPVMNKQFETIAEALYPDRSDGIKVYANICQDSVGCMGGHLPDKSISVAAGGKFINVIDLAPFADLYKRATGKELKFVKLVAENGVEDGQPYAATYVVPVEKSDGEIKEGTPIFWVGVSSKTLKVYTDKNLIAMR
jgi:hypothetical protein